MNDLRKFVGIEGVGVIVKKTVITLATRERERYRLEITAVPQVPCSLHYSQLREQVQQYGSEPPVVRTGLNILL